MIMFVFSLETKSISICVLQFRKNLWIGEFFAFKLCSWSFHLLAVHISWYNCWFVPQVIAVLRMGAGKFYCKEQRTSNKSKQIVFLRRRKRFILEGRAMKGWSNGYSRVRGRLGGGDVLLLKWIITRRLKSLWIMQNGYVLFMMFPALIKLVWRVASYFIRKKKKKKKELRRVVTI